MMLCGETFCFFSLAGVARMKVKALIHLQLPIYTERHRTGQLKRDFFCDIKILTADMLYVKEKSTRETVLFECGC